MSLINEGRYGKIYKVNDNNYWYGLKRIYHDANGITNLVEIDILSRISHPNIIKLINYKIDDISTDLLMPLYECNLHEMNMNFFNNDTKLSFIRDVVSGIKFLHESGIYHCDLKTTNIMYDSQKLYIIDFGLSLYQHHPDEYCEQTNLFKSPEEIYKLLNSPKCSDEIECLVNKSMTKIKSDYWALGLNIMYILTGKYIFKGTLDNIFNHQIIYMSNPFKFLHELVSPEYTNGIYWLLHPDPTQRSVDQFIQKLNIDLIFGKINDIDYNTDVIIKYTDVLTDLSKYIYDICITLQLNKYVYLGCLDKLYRVIDYDNNYILVCLTIIMIMIKIWYRIFDIDQLLQFSDTYTINDLICCEISLINICNGYINSSKLYHLFNDYSYTHCIYPSEILLRIKLLSS